MFRRSVYATFFLLTGFLLTACVAATGGRVIQVTPLPSSNPAAEAVMAQVTPTALPTATSAAAAPEVIPSATPTPLQVVLAEGEARAIARATDVAYQPTPRNPVAFADFPVPITFDEFYDGYNMRTGLILSDKLLSLDGQEVIMEGYMAPPLKADLDFFVLTRIRLAICPFCSTDADWPNDIALIYMPEGDTIVSTQNPVRIVGQMEIGSSMDHESGMVSLVRIYANQVEVLQ